MKTYLFKCSLFLLLSSFLASCFEDQLSLTPYDAIVDEKLFESEANAEAALVMVYRGRSWWRITNFTMEYYGDPSGTGSTSGPANAAANQYWQKSVTPENGFIDGHWNELWAHAARANNFLAFIDITPFRDPARKLAAISEAKFMRALHYHIMTMIWGSIPLITDLPAQLSPPRNTEEECYAFLIDELEYCIENLPETNIGVLRPGEWEARPDRYSAMALLAKVLMMAPEPLYDLDRAINLISDVIGSGKYELEPFYGDLMMVDNKDSREGIFLINFTNNGNPQDGSNSASLAVPAQIWYRPTREFFNSFEAGDTRRDVDINRIYIPPVRDDLYLGKLGYDKRAINGFVYDSYPQWVLRLADMLLLKAEALAKKDYNANATEIFSLIEQVRNRAFQGQPHKIYRAADFSNMDDFWEFLWWERRKELYYETHCFFDAKRMGLCEKILGLQEYQEKLPLPAYQLILNRKLVQNPGY